MFGLLIIAQATPKLYAEIMQDHLNVQKSKAILHGMHFKLL